MCLANGGSDLETCGEESKIPIRWNEHGAACDAAAQAEEEGRTNGLNDFHVPADRVLCRGASRHPLLCCLPFIVA